MQKERTKPVAAHLLALVLAGAGAALAQPGATPPAGSWTLLRLTDARGTVTPGPDAPTLTLAPGAGGTGVSGSTGCNTLTARGEFAGRTLRLGPLATTRRTCGPERDALEARYLSALSRARGLSVSDRLLVLSTGKERLVFVPRTPRTPSLFAEWRFADAGDTAPTLRLDPAGRVSGDTGCNVLSGTYTLEGQALRFSALATTRRACPGEALDRQETAYLRLLGQVRAYRLEGERLILRLEDGSERSLTRTGRG